MATQINSSYSGDSKFQVSLEGISQLLEFAAIIFLAGWMIVGAINTEVWKTHQDRANRDTKYRIRQDVRQSDLDLLLFGLNEEILTYLRQQRPSDKFLGDDGVFYTVRMTPDSPDKPSHPYLDAEGQEGARNFTALEYERYLKMTDFRPKLTESNS